MTPKEADDAVRTAGTIPMSSDEIKSIVADVVGKTRPTWGELLAAVRRGYKEHTRTQPDPALVVRITERVNEQVVLVRSVVTRLIDEQKHTPYFMMFGFAKAALAKCEREEDCGDSDGCISEACTPCQARWWLWTHGGDMGRAIVKECGVER